MQATRTSTNVFPLVRSGNGFRSRAALLVFALTYVLSWLFLVPVALDSHQLLPFHIPPLFALPLGLMPLVAALVTAGLVNGRAGIRRVFGRLLRWRVNVIWYLIALFGPAAFFLAGAGLFTLTGGTLTSLLVNNLSPVQLVIVFPVALLEYAILNTEEFAWRGVALPHLQARYSALAASLIVGVVHTLWHLPYFFTAGRPFYQQMGLPLFALWTIALTVLFTWVFNNTRGSLLLAVLFHAANGVWGGVLFAPSSPGPYYWMVGVVAFAAIVVTLVYGPRRLTRKPEAEFAAATETP